MACMKCGRETSADQIFCQDCLLDMERYPVKPGTAVLLPIHRESSVTRKAPKRRAPSAEDQVKWLKKRVRLLTILLLLCVLLIVCLAFPAAQHLMEDRVRPGQNYSSIVTTTAPAESAAANTG